MTLYTSISVSWGGVGNPPVSRSVDEEDRRSFFAALTPAGHRRLREARPTHNEVIRTNLTRRLTASQLASLGAVWETILES